MLSDLLFQVLLVICCTLFAFAHYVSCEKDSTALKKGVELFTSGTEINQIFDTSGASNSGGSNSITPTDFYSPFIVATNEMMVALAGVNSTSSSEKEHINVLARHVEIKEASEWLSKAIDNNIDKNWQKQFAVKKDWKDKTKLKFILAAAQKNCIYVLLVNDTGQDGSSALDGATQCDYCFFTGTFGESLKGKINWEDKKPFTENIKKLKEQLTSNSLKNIPSNGYVLFEEKQNALFALQFEEKSNNSKKVFAFIELEQKTEPTIKFAKFEAEGECAFKLFSWKTKIMMAKYCRDAGNSMHELQENREGWKVTDKPISYLLPYLQNKNNFTVASIESEDTLLFTQDKTTKCTGEKQLCVDLWITDGSRLYNVGPIVSGDNKVTSAGLLYTKEHLFSLHKETNTEKKIVFTHLQDQQKKIKLALKAWKESNNKVQNFYKDIPTVTNSRITDGLVGFLSSDIDKGKKQWIDKYLNVDATITVNGVRKEDDEITFSGAGAGAVWRVCKTEGNEQPYNLKDFGFTLVAKVKINGNENKKNSILGISLKENSGNVKRKISLWCSDEGKWAVGKKGDPTELVSTGKTCELEETYLVVLVLKKESDTLEVYIDEEKLDTKSTDSIKIAQAEIFSHFYFGADEDQSSVETQVSVKNVLLYNRPLDGNEITNLKVPTKKRITNPEETDGKNNTPGQQKGDNTKEDKNVSKEESGGTERKQSSSPPPTTEDSAARVGVVGVLCFMLFGVFTSLGRYVY